MNILNFRKNNKLNNKKFLFKDKCLLMLIKCLITLNNLNKIKKFNFFILRL